MHEWIGAAWVRLRRAQGDAPGAACAARRLRTTTAKAGRPQHAIDLCGLEVLALWISGAQAESLKSFSTLLDATQSEGHIRSIAEAGAQIGDLVAQWLETRRHAGLDAEVRTQMPRIQRIKAALPLPDVPRPRLLEPLTERETEVLALLASGKTHIKHLYGKLAARNRTEALLRARALRLLP